MTAFDYDLFISHASDDKNEFVRPLVGRLVEEHLSVWYDETELRPGDRLIESIERGLSRSRFGLVVISRAFLARRWPRSELDALTNRELATGESVLLPVWLDVDADTVREYSPLLVDRVAILGSRGLAYTASRVLEVIRPGRSPVVLAREILAGYGIATPPPSDMWWLDQIESAAERDDEGGWQSAMLWARWAFPLPAKTPEPQQRAERLARAVLQNSWVSEAGRRPITQITPPADVHAFIEEMPGLAEACDEHPSYLGAYAPQLLIPGFGGEFETLFDDWLEYAAQRGRVDETVAFHLRSYGEIDAAGLACTFVQGELHGPSVKYYDTIDYFFWLLSDASRWMPEHARQALIEGFIDWQQWLNPGPDDPLSPLFEAAWEAREKKVALEIDDDWFAVTAASAAESIKRVGLPDPPDVLAERLIATGAIGAFVAGKRHRRRVRDERQAG